MFVESSVRPVRCARMIEFPDDRSLGLFGVRPAGAPCALDFDVLGFARGTVVVPAGTDAVLRVPDETVADGFEHFADLPADALDILQLLTAPGTCDGDVAYLAGMTGLRMLDLYGTRIGDASCVVVGALTALEWLSFTGTAVTDDGVAELAHLDRLERLSLKDTLVTDAAIDTLVRLPNLRWLSLAYTAVTGDGLRALSNAPSLQYVSVIRTVVQEADRDAFSACRPDVGFVSH